MYRKTNRKLGFEQKRRGRPTKIEIPQVFECLGHQIPIYLCSQERLREVAQANSLAHPDDVLEGLYVYTTKEIYLDKGMSRDTLEQAYLHERNHCMLYLMGENELAENEAFCELMAQILYQILKSQKGRQQTLPYRKKEQRVKDNGTEKEEVDAGGSQASWKFHSRRPRAR